MANASGERPVIPFVLSLVAGLLVLAGGAMVGSLSSGLPTYRGMMGGYYYGGMMGGYYGMMRGFGFGGGWYYGLAAVGLISGIVILVGAVMMYTQPTKTSTWGAIVFAFSVASLIGMGGFYVGLILGVVGGVLAITWKPGA